VDLAEPVSAADAIKQKRAATFLFSPTFEFQGKHQATMKQHKLLHNVAHPEVN
jgi:hypothetical protein